MKPIRVLLVDDHALVRAGLRALLEDITDDGFEVVGEAGNGREALAKIEQMRPQVVLMDLMMPEMNGMEVTAHISARFPNTRVLILSIYLQKEFVLQALAAGAAGYLPKTCTPDELARAITAVARGERYLSSAIASHVIEASLEQFRSQPSSLGKLTPRQREVLQLIAEGNTTKNIASKLGLSTKTVESYRTELMEALDIHDIAGLVRYAIRMKIVSPDY